MPSDPQTRDRAPSRLPIVLHAGGARLVLAVLLLSSTLSACGGGSSEDIARGKDIFTTCATCHGKEGQGNQELDAPNIAGLPKWYIVREIEKFRAGHRGSAAADTAGRRMAAIASTLEGEDAIRAVAAYVASLPHARVGSTVDGDPAKGKVEYQACASCHANDGKGRPGLPGERVPPVAGLADWYVVSQVDAFKKGWRGTRTSDLPAMKMRAVVIPLDSAATANVAAYIRTFE